MTQSARDYEPHCLKVGTNLERGRLSTGYSIIPKMAMTTGANAFARINRHTGGLQIHLESYHSYLESFQNPRNKELDRGVWAERSTSWTAPAAP